MHAGANAANALSSVPFIVIVWPLYAPDPRLPFSISYISIICACSNVNSVRQKCKFRMCIKLKLRHYPISVTVAGLDWPTLISASFTPSVVLMLYRSTNPGIATKPHSR
jgi:hypothetical protein